MASGYLSVVERRRRLEEEEVRARGKGYTKITLFDLPDAQFKLHTRISKENVRRIAKHFEGQLGRVNDRGSPPTTRNGSPYKYNWLIPIGISIMVGREKKTHEKPTPFFWLCQRNQRRILCLHT